VLLEFGMNDGTYNMAPAAFRANLETIISLVRAKSPDTEFILLAPLIANPDRVQAGNQEEFLAVINQMSADLAGVAAADFTGLCKALLASNKRYVDLSANNINHPNDFMQTCMAAAVTGLLKKSS
jgi:lysophospholipase L1-like esterase